MIPDEMRVRFSYGLFCTTHADAPPPIRGINPRDLGNHLSSRCVCEPLFEGRVRTVDPCGGHFTATTILRRAPPLSTEAWIQRFLRHKAFKPGSQRRHQRYKNLTKPHKTSCSYNQNTGYLLRPNQMCVRFVTMFVISLKLPYPTPREAQTP